jgi:hypothetical protein
MSATASEDPALNDYLMTGETLFVAGAALAFVSDVALTFRSLVEPNWVGLAVGCAFIAGTLYLVNWLYTGKKEARTPAAIWAAVQIAIALIATILLMNLKFRWDYRLYPMGRSLPSVLSIPQEAYLLGAFKAAAYGFFLYLLTQRGPALFFLRRKGGEAVEVPSPTAPPEDIHPTGTVVALSADQSGKADALANTLQNASIALMAAGFFQAIVGGQRIAANSPYGWMAFGEGVVYLTLGLLAMGPVTPVRNIKERGADTAYIADALGKLVGLFSKQIALTLALIALTVGALVLRLTKG